MRTRSVTAHTEVLPVQHRFALALTLVSLAAPPLSSQAGDSARAAQGERAPAPLFTRRDAVLGVLFTGASIAIMQVDDRIAERIQRPSVQESDAMRSVASVVTEVNEKSLFFAALLGYAGGRLGHSRSVADVSWHVAEAVFISSAANTVVRGALGRSRPFVTAHQDPFDFHYGKGFGELKYRAYPSIHASASFATAAALAGEIGLRQPASVWYAGPLLYGAASLPGFARMYHDRHWASDVVMGAFVGAITGVKVVRYHHGRPGNRLDRIFLGTTLVPDGRGGARVAARLAF